MGNCCEPEETPVDSCHGGSSGKPDYFLWLLISLSLVFYFGHLLDGFLNLTDKSLSHLFHSFFQLMNTMSWGILLGVVFVGLLGRVPREYVISLLGRPGSRGSLLRATAAGLLLDLCSHGILMVGMKLYERGASIGQVMAFLIASPWNSLSLTVILISLVGWYWTLLFIILSGVVALITGLVFDQFVKTKTIPANPNQVDLPANFNLIKNIKKDISRFQFSFSGLVQILKNGVLESKAIVKWLFLGAILASLVQTFVETEVLTTFFGPSLIGLGLTLVATTLIEVCSEGSTPLAAELINRAQAPGNGFTFLMAGVSTDYTEVLSLKSTTKSWKIALLLPAITVPQIIIIGYILNQ